VKVKIGTLTQMRQVHLILVTGLPATGKSTLARKLARRYGLPLICKDTIKEPLLDALGASDRAQSRRLSDASFAVMFALARDLLSAGSDVILEGNFRPGEHEASLRTALSSCDVDVAGAVRVAQVLCRVAAAERLARLAARAGDAARHAGHRDAQLANDHLQTPSAFLELSGERLAYDNGSAVSQCGVDWFETLDRWLAKRRT
jgi:predicted kinase